MTRKSRNRRRLRKPQISTDPSGFDGQNTTGNKLRSAVVRRSPVTTALPTRSPSVVPTVEKPIRRLTLRRSLMSGAMGTGPHSGRTVKKRSVSKAIKPSAVSTSIAGFQKQSRVGISSPILSKRGRTPTSRSLRDPDEKKVLNTCKERPDPYVKGSGSGVRRRFVTWCKD
ncbi:MAG: hypothetical protein [Microviridae sp.]|nr:MAG: hypothetical protein [Microviridae sp.]